MKGKMNKHGFQNATGRIDYTLMNDYMFRAVMQENEKVLRGLVCSLLRLNPGEVTSIIITNPIELGKAIDEKAFVLDLKVLLNNTMIINIEVQVVKQLFWNDRSLLYLCKAFNNLKSGDKYRKIKPTCHIGILDFTPFPEHPEFYATNKMMNIKKHYIYNDNFTLNVLDLNQTALATDEDKKWKLNYWARLFKAKTWEDLKMLAQKDNMFEETCETMYLLNQEDSVRYLCEAREEGLRELESAWDYVDFYKAEAGEYKAKLSKKEAEIAEKDSEVARLRAEIQRLKELQGGNS